jgi:hypothetical protein
MVKITINDNVTKLKEKSKSKNTQDKYEGDWLKFIDYCKNKYNCNPLEVDDLDSAYALTANYMDWLHEDPEAKILKGSSNIPGRKIKQQSLLFYCLQSFNNSKDFSINYIQISSK